MFEWGGVEVGVEVGLHRPSDRHRYVKKADIDGLAVAGPTSACRLSDEMSQSGPPPGPH